MHKIKITTLAIVILLFSTFSQSQAAKKIEVDIYKGDVATVNSYIFSNGVSLVAMDVQRATSHERSEKTR